MNGDERTSGRRLERLPTGVAGLDTILGGGLFKGGVYIVQGMPGVGKTILANQICYNAIAQGERAAYVTLLAESHARLLQHLDPLDFFEPKRIPEQIYYVSGYRAVEEEGLKGLIDLLRRQVKAQGATIVVLDGLASAQELVQTEHSLKRFIHELQVHASLSGFTAILLSSGSGEPFVAEHTMVDGIFDLADHPHQGRVVRELVVKKFRGSGYLRGSHAYEISDRGLSVYPRVESRAMKPYQGPSFTAGRMASGVKGFDAMLGGGLPAHTSTLLLGPSGSGKTTFGLSFVALSSAAEPGVFFGFYETPDRLRELARSIGLDLDGPVERGELELIWEPPGERILDALGERLIETVRARGAKRVYVDGLGGFYENAIHRDRLSHFFAAVTGELRRLGATVIATMESLELIGEAGMPPLGGISILTENFVLLRFVEKDADLRRLVSIIKVRGSGFDHSLREFAITDKGLAIGDRYASGEGLLTHLGKGPRPSGPGHEDTDRTAPGTRGRS